jgi:hypothetical protein
LRSWRRSLGVVLGFGALVAWAYVFRIRKWHLRWGASDEEIARAMPLDGEIERPTYVTNRAVTIGASAEEVWPWIAQMGERPRGGFYSYLSVERLLRMRVANADRILPEFQDLRVGQAIDRAGTMLVKAVEPNRVLVLGPSPTPEFDATWAIGLFPSGEGRTRLVSRCRALLPRGVKGLLMFLVLDPGQFVMERKMLLEIKKRAETLASLPRDRPVGSA